MKQLIINLTTGLYLTGKSIRRESKILLIMSTSILILIYISLSLMPNLINGLIDTIMTKLQDTNVSQIQIEPNSKENYIANSEELITKIQEIEGVKGVNENLNIPAELEFDGNSVSYGTFVVNDETFRDAFNVEKYITEGELFNESDANQIVLGVEVAGRGQFNEFRKSLAGIEIGDKLNLSLQGQTAEFELVGIYDAEFAQADSNSYIRLRDFKNLGWKWNTQPRRINVSVNNPDEIDRIIKEINALGYELEVSSWEELSGALDEAVESFDLISRMIQAVSLVIGAITIFIITYVELANKQKQIGIQRAIGITDQAIFINFVSRGLLIAIISIITGFLLYLYVIVPFEHAHPLKFPYGEAKLIVDIPLMIRMASLMIIVVLISSSIPTKQILRKPILKAIWGSN